MSTTVPHRHLWSPERLSSSDLHLLLNTAAMLKRAKRRDHAWGPLVGRHVALLCSKRGDVALAFERAVATLGGTATVLDADEWHARTGEGVAEAAKLLGRLYDAIDCCDLPPHLVEQIETHCHVPVFNGLTQSSHPLRGLGELLTMRETGHKPLHLLRLRVAGGTALSGEVATLARLAGIQVAAKDGVAAVTTEDDSTAAIPDFILDDGAKDQAHRLTMPAASPVEQAQLTGLLAENSQCALQALLVCGIQ